MVSCGQDPHSTVVSLWPPSSSELAVRCLFCLWIRDRAALCLEMDLQCFLLSIVVPFLYFCMCYGFTMQGKMYSLTDVYYGFAVVFSTFRNTEVALMLSFHPVLSLSPRYRYLPRRWPVERLHPRQGPHRLLRPLPLPREAPRLLGFPVSPF